MQTRQPKEIPAVRGLVVSIHDVSPLTKDVTDAMLADLKTLGISTVSLLVIPNHHHRAPIAEDPAFCEWLRGRAAEGHEIVLHGYYHLREKRADDGAVKRLVTESYTAGEGEFHDLSEAAAAELLERGRGELRRAGLEPSGFIAPAWLLGGEAAEAARKCGFSYTTRLTCVDDFERGRTYDSQSLVYSVRAAWRRWTSLRWNSLLLRLLGDRALVRAGLHPPDWSFPEIREHARKCLTRALASREAMTYDGWLRRQRAVHDR